MSEVFYFFIIMFVIMVMLGFLITAFVNPCFFSHFDFVLGESFCSICGVQLRPYCAECDDYKHPSADFCNYCGDALIWEVSGNE